MDLFYIILAASIILSYIVGSTITYLVLRASRILDIKVINNYCNLLSQRDEYIAMLLSLPPMPRRQEIIEPSLFRSRSDEDEARLEAERL